MIKKKVFIAFLLSLASLLIVCCSGGVSPLFPEKSTFNDSWLITWGGTYNDTIWSQGISPDGDIYLGAYLNSILKSGSAKSASSSFNTSSSLMKYDSSGGNVWSHIWKGDSNLNIFGVECDTDRNVYISGTFSGNMNFDPLEGNAERISDGEFDIFIAKYDSEGNHQWTFTWGDSDTDFYKFKTIDKSGNILLVCNGSRPDTKFNSSAYDYHLAGSSDEYMSKFDQNGNLIWTIGIPMPTVSIASDSNNSLYLAGNFTGVHDFDPGSEKDYLSSNSSSQDIFISKFDENGSYIWTKSWGDSGLDEVSDIFYSVSDTIICVGTGDNHEYNVPENWVLYNYSFLNCIDSEGNLLWTGNWGADVLGNQAFACRADQYGNVYVTGEFKGNVDFNPGPGEDIHISTKNHPESYISKFDQDGKFISILTMGGNGNSNARFIDLDNSGGIYLSGDFSGEMEFNIGGQKVNKNSNDSDAFIMRISQDDMLNSESDL